MSGMIPEKQKAVQLIAPDELRLNREKPVFSPGPYQILCRVEAVGLCFSDLKLLKQFSEHVRKGDIQSGIDKKILDEVPSYVPGDKPTVPGHESVVIVCQVGEKVTDIETGARYLVQTDYRWLPNVNSNASFGYNFEGGLQQYVLMDQRIITSPDGDSMLIPASKELSASAVALVEPWACVEDSYAAMERRTLKAGGKMLVAAEGDIDQKLFLAFIKKYGNPGQITIVAKSAMLADIDIDVVNAADVSELDNAAFDDVIYFGADARTAAKLFPKVGTAGLLNIVQCDGKFGVDVETQIGRVHYGGIRVIGTTGSDPADSMQFIPKSGEIRKGDKINVIGAGGPMGVMHVIRNICQGVGDITVYAGDLDAERLEALSRIAKPLAQSNSVGYEPYDPSKGDPLTDVDYIAIMAPVPKIVADSISSCAEKGIINIFAGIPATVSGEIDLDAYIEKHLYFIGTSGSVLSDMKAVLAKVEAGKLDTNLSVAAICGLEGAVEGIRAVENRLIPGKIIVYPSVSDMGLITLEELKDKLPDVAAGLSGGLWTKQAEDRLLKK
ncbi:MAG: alcohol dehydrogenase catalytic domain-containing protein [Sedimentisphaerales bacterium]|nr:alcohol dehydrogenase catalytic domain-containing protein [Sedimentisphaerales bacterium]